MTIISAQFAIFFLLVLGVHFLLPRRLQNLWLLIASYAFYLSWDWRFVLQLIALTVTNYALGIALGKCGGTRAGLLGLGVALNAAALVVFKSANFFVPEFVSLLEKSGLSFHTDSLGWILPLGLSYRVLENISYLVDVYRGQTAASRDLINFSLYLVYFPKIVAGPIERARNFLPRLSAERALSREALGRSLALVGMGLVRKVIIADTLHAAITPSAFIRPAEYPAPELLAWLFIYAFALYNDFAGYTSIARGISGMLGIELSPNFNLPYFSLSFNQFWNRWHMSLSFWLRDYIFFPLRRWLLRKKPGQEGWLSLAIPPMATMLVSSLWHGSGWSILLWGGLHGIYLIGEQLVRSRQVQAPAKQPAWKQALSMGTVFLLVSLAWAPFRMDVGTTLEYWGALFELSTYRLVFEYPRMFLRIFIILLFMLPVVGLDWLQLRCQDEAFALRWPLVVQSLSLALVFFLLFILVDSSGAVPFVYEGF